MSKKPVVVLVLGAVAATALAVVWYANRTHTEDLAIGGRWTMVLRWLKISEYSADRNRDGRVDAKGVFDPPIPWSPHAIPSISWLDQDFDGRFELEIRWDRASATSTVAIDTNGDGTYDKILTGEEADKYEQEVIRPRSNEIAREFERPGKDE